jgi:hypothetical protein
MLLTQRSWSNVDAGSASTVVNMPLFQNPSMSAIAILRQSSVMNRGDVGNYSAKNNQQIRGKSKTSQLPLCGGIQLAKAFVNVYVPSESRIAPHEQIKEVEHAAELVRGVYRHVKCVRVV